MADLFLYGRMRDPAMRRAVFGTDVPTRDAEISGARVVDAHAPALIPDKEGVVEGLLVDLSGHPGVLGRSDVVAAVNGQKRAPLRIRVDGTEIVVDSYRSKNIPADARSFDLTEWAVTRGTLDRAVAREVLTQWPDASVEVLRRRLTQIEVRCQSRLNARAHAGPTTLRRKAAAEDVRIAARRQPYAGFFSVEEMDLVHATFDGKRSDVLQRAALVSGDAVVVLPYDAKRDRVLLVEQFRAGAFARGDSQPWSMETVAGRIDPGETPAEAARREAREEAGLELGELVPVTACYPSPGFLTEFLYLYVALTELPDGTAGMGGVEEEGEDIRTHVVPFGTLLRLIETGEVQNGPLMLIAMMLERRRGQIRTDFGS